MLFNPYESHKLTVNFFGVITKLKYYFNDHINDFAIKISKFVGVMRRLFCQLPADVMFMFYYSLVYSHVTYAILGIFPCNLCYTGMEKIWMYNAVKIES